MLQPIMDARILLVEHDWMLRDAARRRLMRDLACPLALGQPAPRASRTASRVTTPLQSSHSSVPTSGGACVSCAGSTTRVACLCSARPLPYTHRQRTYARHQQHAGR